MSTTLPFGETVAAQHRRVDPDEWENLYVVGDVHGCFAELQALLAELGVREDDLVVFLGDLVRKGPNGHAVVSTVRSHPNFLSVRGNNEELVLAGEAGAPDLTAADREWLASLPVAVSWADSLAVHAGIDPRKPLSAQTVDDLQNVRSLAGDGYDPPFWFDRYAGPARVFFGHTVLSRPAVGPRAVGLDTGCVHGGELTAYDWRRDRVVSVPATRAAVPRPESKIATPFTAVSP